MHFSKHACNLKTALAFANFGIYSTCDFFLERQKERWHVHVMLTRIAVCVMQMIDKLPILSGLSHLDSS